MDDDDYFKQQLIRAADLAQPPGWRAYFSEGVGTAMLGAMSIALAIVVFTADAYSLIRNQALGNFHRTEWSHGADHLIPSPVCAMVVVAGEGLGLAGLALGWLRNRKLSPLSLVGFSACFANICIVIANHIYLSS